MKHGFPDSLSPDVAAEMEGLWSQTCMHKDDIARRLNERFGTAFEGRNIEWHARRRCWTREMISKSFNHRSVVLEQLSTRSLARSNRIPSDPDAVRRVPPGTFATGGFSMIGGRL